MNLKDKSLDEKIRTALRNADKKGGLNSIATVTGISGGAQQLRDIINSNDELSRMDRGMLYILLSA